MPAETATEEQQRVGPGAPMPLRRMTSPFAPIRLALWRLGRGWRLLLAVGLGMLVTVTLICTVPLYSSLVANVQLQHQLSVQSPSDINIEVDTTIAPARQASANGILHQTATAAQQYLKSFAPTATLYLTLDSYIAPLAIDSQKLPGKYHYLGGNPHLLPYVPDYQQALPHMLLLAGRLPQPVVSGGMPEVLVTKKMGLKPGDTITLAYNTVTVKVVGVWFPKNLNDPYWNDSGDTFDTSIPPCRGFDSTCAPSIYPVLFENSTFFDLFISKPSAQPYGMVVHYISFTNIASINVATMADVSNAIQNYKAQLNATLYDNFGITGLGIATQLDNLLQGLQQQFSLLAQPLYIIIAQVVGLALLFELAMAMLLIEAQAGDIATLKSRGASLTQLLTNFTLQGTFIAALAALAGPYLAAALSVAIVRFFIPGAGDFINHQTAGTNYLTKIVAPQLVFKPAVAGALLGLAALIIAVWLAARRDVLAFRREVGRSTGSPFWRRYYLDIALVVFCAAGYLELGEFGGLNVRQQLGQSGNTGADSFQLISPGLLLLGGALLVLRLFPLVTRFGAWLANKSRGANSMLAFAQLARSTTQYSRLALLLTLAVGLGIFALTFQNSIRTNALSQASFLVGCDEQVMLKDRVDGTPLTAPFQPIIGAMSGVKAITPIYNTTVTNPRDGLNAGVLGIDPRSFAQAAYWRSDYSRQPLASLMRQMQAHAQGALAGDQQHPIWTLVDTNFASMYSLAPGVVFTLITPDSPSVGLFFVVGAVVNNIPTQNNAVQTGFVVFNIADYINALKGPQGENSINNYNGPNQYWLRTNGSPTDDARRARALHNPDLWVATVIDRTTVAAQAVADPLTAGMTGLLLTGALVAALLAILGSVLQSSVAAKQRLTQFAILRTLGGQRGQLLIILLSQQLVVYLFSLVGGTALGLVLSTATLPFLQFSTSAVSTAQRLPAYQIAFSPNAIALFYATLALAFILALLIGTQITLRGGLGKTLRIGED